jgi:hypothetical protein
VRHGHIATDETQPAHPAEGLRHLAGGDLDFHVAGSDPGLVEGRLVHPRGGGMGDRIPDHREPGRLVLPGVEPFAG